MSPDEIGGSDWARALTAAKPLIRSRKMREALLNTRWGELMRKITGTAPRELDALVSSGAFVRRSFGVAQSSASDTMSTGHPVSSYFRNLEEKVRQSRLVHFSHYSGGRLRMGALVRWSKLDAAPLG